MEQSAAHCEMPDGGAVQRSRWHAQNIKKKALIFIRTLRLLFCYSSIKLTETLAVILISPMAMVSRGAAPASALSIAMAA